ncbi:hypothetical protein [Arsukibacterium sp.]|uniref:hypothetical protein n=1 Tax=Arsukibacterium sp. TaxID=1977258 RepID=UPI002FDA46F8
MMDKMEKDTSPTPGASRRKFLVKAGMGSLPVLMALKSKGAWGYSTQNCNLSATVSKMQSAQAQQFEACVNGFKSHGSGMQFFAINGQGNGNGNGHGRFGYFLEGHTNYHGGFVTYNGHVINNRTPFNAVFGGADSRTLMVMVQEDGTTALERNITSLFLHSMFPGSAGSLPDSDAIVRSYTNAVTSSQISQLDTVLKLYIDGKA